MLPFFYEIKAFLGFRSPFENSSFKAFGEMSNKRAEMSYESPIERDHSMKTPYIMNGFRNYLAFYCFHLAWIHLNSYTYHHIT